MKFKKLAMLFTASALLLSSAFSFSAYADDTEDEEIYAEESDESSAEESETITSKDKTYEYVVSSDDSDKEFAVLEAYLGNDSDVVIPSEIDGIKVKKIGDNTFYDKKTIKTVTVPATIEDFGRASFYGCESLLEFKVDDANEIYKAVDGMLFGKDDQVLFCCPPAKKLTSYTVPEGVVAIANSAFGQCKDLETVELPSTLKYIMTYSFAECTALKSITLPESLTEINDFAFSGCSALAEVNFAEDSSLATIGNAAFYDCGALTQIDFPDSVTSVGQGAFVSTGMKSVTVPPTIYDIGYSAFGFYTDQSGDIVAMDDFTVYGYEGSYAQSYCSDNEVKFEAIEPENTDDGKNSSDIKPGVIIAVCIAAAGLLIIVIVVVYKVKHSDYDAETAIGDYDDENSDEEESGEAESSENSNGENADENENEESEKDPNAIAIEDEKEENDDEA